MRIDRRSMICFAVAAALVVVTSVLVLVFGRYVEFVPTVIIRGAWGPGPDQFGTDLVPGQRPKGPLAFAVSPGGDWIVVADSYNERVVIVGQNATSLIVPTPGQRVASVAADSHRAFLLAGTELTVIDRKGQVAATGKLPPTDSQRLSARLLSSPSGILLEDTVLAVDELVKTYYELTAPAGGEVDWREMGMLAITWTGERRLEGIRGESVAASSRGPASMAATDEPGVYRVSHSGRSWLLSVPEAAKWVRLLWASPAAVFTVCESMDGRLVISRHQCGKSGTHLSPGLQYMHSPGPIGLATRVAVDGRGTIYVAEADDNGYAVIRLEPRYRWKWRS